MFTCYTIAPKDMREIHGLAQVSSWMSYHWLLELFPLMITYA